MSKLLYYYVKIMRNVIIIISKRKNYYVKIIRNVVKFLRNVKIIIAKCQNYITKCQNYYQNVKSEIIMKNKIYIKFDILLILFKRIYLNLIIIYLVLYAILL